jgi:ABC-2 type transport system ATP-binding protein
VIDRLRHCGRTVILTTHYIEEAEKLCDRVAVIDHGKVIALGSPRQLMARALTSSRIEFRIASPVEPALLRQLPFVNGVAEDQGAYLLRTQNATQALVELVKWLEAGGHELLDLHVTRPTLEDTFIELTGQRIRQ